MSRTRWRWGLVLALLVVPLAEIAVIIAVGKVIGGWPTLGLLLAESAFGAWLVQRESRSVFRSLREALRSGVMPNRELADGALVLVGGTLLLTPGFLTDVVGFAALLPVTRPLARRTLEAAIRRRLTVFVPGAPGAAPTGGWGRQSTTEPPTVVESEVLREPD